MLILTLLAAVVVGVVLLEAMTYTRQGTIWIARWAWPVVVTSLIFSFPFSLVTMLYLLVTEELVRGHGLALWITNSWRNVGVLCALNWVVIFAFLKATK